MSWVRRNNFVVVLCVVLVAIVVGVIVAPSNKTHKHVKRFGIGTAVHRTIAPKLTLLGGNVCHEGSHESFQYRISGFPPHRRVRLVVIYAEGGYYWNLAGSKGMPAGVIQLGSDGSYTSHNTWQCWWSSGPGSKPDPLDTYVAWAYDPKTQLVSPPITFADVP